MYLKLSKSIQIRVIKLNTKHVTYIYSLYKRYIIHTNGIMSGVFVLHRMYTRQMTFLYPFNVSHVCTASIERVLQILCTCIRKTVEFIFDN